MAVNYWREDFSDVKKALNQHGILLLLGWGFFIPAALACSLLLRHHPGDAWIYHTLLTLVGMILNLAGWIIGMREFDTLKRGPRTNPDPFGPSMGWWTGDNISYAHAVFGMVAMIGALLNICCVIFIRLARHPNETFWEWPWWQKLGQMGHRVLGYILVVLALITVGLGTRMARDLNAEYLKGFVGTLAATTLFFLVCWSDKIRYDLQAQATVQPTTNETHDTHMELEQQKIHVTEQDETKEAKAI